MTDADILINYANAVNKYNLAKEWATQYGKSSVIGSLTVDWSGASSCAGYREVKYAVQKSINRDVVGLINRAIEDVFGSEVNALASDAAEAMKRMAKV